MNTNSKLLELQEQWNQNVLFPYVENLDNNILSRPFYFGVSEEYLESKHKIMIVGQETRDYGHYNHDWPMPAIQKWGVDYLRRQLWKSGTEEFIKGHKYNRSGFWTLFRSFLKRGYVPCWNNIDKIQQAKGMASTIRLSNEHKRIFCRQYGEDNKSLLQREIELVKPDVVLFITGPNYHVSMTESLGLVEGALEELKPNRTKVCREITKEAGLGMPAFWAYHPSYLNRIHKISVCVQFVLDSLS